MTTLLVCVVGKMSSHGLMAIVFMGEPRKCNAKEWVLFQKLSKQHTWAAHLLLARQQGLLCVA